MFYLIPLVSKSREDTRFENFQEPDNRPRTQQVPQRTKQDMSDTSPQQHCPVVTRGYYRDIFSKRASADLRVGSTTRSLLPCL